MATSLTTYRSKRDFAVTAEPSGEAAPEPGRRFVVQQHAARRMHYDFRLEHAGVLLSWAVPKGPSLKVADKRLAVRTEDHPIDYADFEGVIPAGQYGGGAVSVWDRGTWQPDGDTAAALAKGRLTFTLAGTKLRGKWHLVKTRPAGKAEQWLLFKSRDDAANDDVDIVAAQPRSVVSERTIDDIAAQRDRVWQSNKRADGSGPVRKPADVGALVQQLPIGFPLTNLDKVLFADAGVTKAQLVAYLAVVADRMLPHVAHRPLTLVRCPNGSARGCFFQKKRMPGTPAAIAPVALVDSDGEAVDYMQLADLAGLVACAQLGALEIHTWGCHAPDVERPDLLVFDLDPDPKVHWDRVVLGALQLRRALHERGLDSFVKTTGGKGLHVVVPVTGHHDWDAHKALSKQVVDDLAAAEPHAYTTTIAKAARHDRIFLDYLRNGRGATFVAPYSPRARPGAPVAMPVAWDALASGLDPKAFTIATVPPRLGLDPWAALPTTKQTYRLRGRK
jgi:bifunctional non-homologous end joining protein LigD|nr:non-homologous end-joining DNA ligase [Kofleriaceae bacterium]